MSGSGALSRRQLLLLLSLLAGRKAFAGDKSQGSSDNGIGGTGLKPEDNGIGGTGFIGTIRRFGSVYINGERIAYPLDVRVEIDGETVAPASMRIGQVARVVADRIEGAWRTDGIVIVSEAVGPITRIDRGRFDILGQSVRAPLSKLTRSLRVGDRVAVSGLRRPDQTIVASLVERREGGMDQIAGVLTGESGDFRIGAQRIVGVSAAVAGERIVTRGAIQNGAFVAHQVKLDTAGSMTGAQTVSIETWLNHEDGALTTADGLRVEDLAGALRPGSYLVVINGEMAGGNTLIARQVEFPNRRGDFPGGGTGAAPGGGALTPGGPGGGIGPGGQRGRMGGGFNAPGGAAGPGSMPFGGTSGPQAPGFPGGGNGPAGFGAPGGFPGGGESGGPSGFGGPGPRR